MRHLLITYLLCHLLVGAANAKDSDAEFLRQMPTNSDRICVGISAVGETLLQNNADTQAEMVTVDALAKKIFDGLSNESSIVYPAAISISGKVTAVKDSAALAALSTRVADLYKRVTKAAWKTTTGRKRLHAARKAIIRTKQELLSILNADPDQTVLFCCFGWRRFPDGSYRETNHAILLSKQSDDTIFVYDPNDPGEPADCKLIDHHTGLKAKWTCAFRKTGQVTEQKYSIVHGKKFFRIARGLTNPLTSQRELAR